VIAIVVLTHNRVHLLRQCVENVLARTSDATREVVVWDNASTDGTGDYLDGLDDPRFIVVRHPRNIGQNAYAEAFRLTSSPYLVELDDDVIDAPAGWDRTLLDAFERLPRIGFLAANLVDDPNDVAAHTMHHERPHLYETVVENGLTLLKGPTGGGCAITSRELHDRVGGFRQDPKRTFWLEDAAYIADIEALGYQAAFLRDLQVHHAGGPFYAPASREKHQYWVDYWKANQRKARAKRLLVRVPFVRRINDRYAFFQLPDAAERPYSPPRS
jgi:GT2 family glycosyltransferase